jgi:hypothetical protein
VFQHAIEAFRVQLQPLFRDQCLRATIRDDVSQLRGRAHRVDWSDHRFRAQDRVVRNDELRAVVEEQSHAVAALDGASLL